ncbi:hypothetical protein DFS34DRAFT_592013 [Phlyctochytrium arcticum]|nr:hypothetical protein DFS34DRAFT_592013 [Phlyctochytrium arcticum]
MSDQGYGPPSTDGSPETSKPQPHSTLSTYSEDMYDILQEFFPELLASENRTEPVVSPLTTAPSLFPSITVSGALAVKESMMACDGNGLSYPLSNMTLISSADTLCEDDTLQIPPPHHNAYLGANKFYNNNMSQAGSASTSIESLYEPRYEMYTDYGNPTWTDYSGSSSAIPSAAPSAAPSMPVSRRGSHVSNASIFASPPPSSTPSVALGITHSPHMSNLSMINVTSADSTMDPAYNTMSAGAFPIALPTPTPTYDADAGQPADWLGVPRLSKRRRASAPERSYVCHFDGCTKVYDTGAGLRYHLKSKHGALTARAAKIRAKPRNILCSRCPDKAFSTRAGLKYHQQTMHAQDYLLDGPSDSGSGSCSGSGDLYHGPPQDGPPPPFT